MFCCFNSTDEKSNIKCPICLRNLKELKSEKIQIFANNCGHLYCYECLVSFRQNSFKKCSICRLFLNKLTLIVSFYCVKCNKINYNNSIHLQGCGHVYCANCVSDLKNIYSNRHVNCIKCKFSFIFKPIYFN